MTWASGKNTGRVSENWESNKKVDSNVYKTAVIGLGNIGFQFNLDPKRKETWSHVSAYEKCDRTELVGAVEFDEEKTGIFHERYKDIPVFKTVSELMENTGAEIVSICTPTRSHAPLIKEVLKYPVKGIFCEKPMAATVGEAGEMVRACAEKGVVLAVNHVRRWEASFLYAGRMLRDGKIGNIRAVNAFYSGQVFNIGTHLFDVIRMITGKDPESASGIPFNTDSPDPDISGWLMFGGNVPCTVIATGKREDLIFEFDIIGSEGRLRILSNGEKLEWYTFTESTRYSGYREQALMDTPSVAAKDRFVEAINDIVKVIAGEKQTVNCSGIDGLYALSMSFGMLESARENGKPVKLNIPSEVAYV